MKVEFIAEPDRDRTCGACDFAARFISQSGQWCERHLPLEDCPTDQIQELVAKIALLSSDFEIDGEGEIRLKEDDDA